MTNPVFVVPSVGKSPDYSRNRPVNLSHCTCLTKDYHFPAGQVTYMILFEGCIDDQGKVLSWGYPTQQEQDADYDRILKAFKVLATDDCGSVCFSHDDMRAAADWQLEQVMTWLQENLLLCDDKLEYCYLEKYPLSGAVINKDKVLEDLKKAMRPTQQEDK
jgi:hypothetical protein